jgi:DNA-binding CsgD family transcriptional regulator
VVVLTPDGEVSAVHGPADKLLPAYFGANGAGTLPAPLAQWAAREATASPERLHLPLVVQRPGRRLVARLVRGPGNGPPVIVLDERRVEPDATPLRELGLTSREAEALWWLTQGATTTEMAASLGVAPATVKKHLERVYRKLGVSSRTGAVAQAFDALTSR